MQRRHQGPFGGRSNTGDVDTKKSEDGRFARVVSRPPWSPPIHHDDQRCLSFLNDFERIASVNYQPTDDDVIRARLRTLGVQEYRFIFDHGKHVSQ